MSFVGDNPEAGGSGLLTPSQGEQVGESSTASLTILNTAPSAQVSVAVEVPQADEDVVAIAVGSDADQDAVSLSYSWTVDGQETSYDTDTVPAEATLKGEIWEVTVTPDDGEERGEPVSASASIANVAPVVDSVILNPSEAYETSVILAVVQSSDVDGDPLVASFAWFVNDALVQEGSLDSVDGALFDKHDVVYVRVTVGDGYVDSEPLNSAALTVLDTAPVVATADIDPGEIYESSELSCLAGGWEDADADPEAYNTRWLVDGGEVALTETLNGDHFAYGQEVVCELTPWDGELEGVAVSSAPVSVWNTPPVIASAALSSTSPAQGETLSLSTTGVEDDDGHSVSLGYEWFVDGSSVSTASELDSSYFAKGQSIYAVVTPFDGIDYGASVTSDTATGVNSLPVISALGLAPSTLYTSDTLVATVSGSDADGDTVTYTYAWTVDGSSVAETGASLSGDSFDKHQVVQVSATPNDGEGDGAAFSSGSVTVLNSLPSITAVDLDATELFEGDTVTCTPSGWADEDGDTADYAYSWTIAGTEVGTSATLDGASFSKGEELVCTVTPWDGEEFGAPLSSATLAVSNTPPVLSSATLSSSSPAEGDTLSVVLGSASDDDGDSISYSYAWYVDGSLVSTASTLDSADFGKGQSIYCVVTPNDGSDDGASVTTDTATALNTLPVISSATLSPTVVYTDSTISASVVSTDADGDTVSYTYAWYVGGSLVGASGSSLAGSYFVKGDSVYLIVTPSDSEGSGAAVTTSSVTVTNSAPSISSVSISPSAPQEGDTLSCAATGWSDADGDSAGYTYSWAVNGSAVSAASTLSGASFDKGDSVICTVTPTDGTDSGSAVSSASVIVVNTAPTLASATLSSTSPQEGDTLSVTLGSASDADGDSISYTYAWYVNGSQVSTASTLDGGSFDKGDSVYAVVTPTDGSDAGASVTTATATVANTAPVISSVSLSDSAPYTGDTLSASVSSTDADGDSVTYSYSWYVNGGLVGGSSASLAGSYFVKGDTIYVSVSPSDGTATGVSVSSATATCQNSAPSAPVVAIDPVEPVAGSDDVLCDITTVSTDADGDSVSYTFAWTQNGSSSSSASTTTYTGDTIAASYGVAGDVWECSVTASDGSASSSAATASATLIEWTGLRTFSTCGQTGYTGPSQASCDSAYAGTTLAGEVTLSGGIQSWTVPVDGTYLVEAMGAQGASGDSSYLGGQGAYMSGEFALSAGDVLYIVVGQEGSGQSSGSNGGGGGGSFVMNGTTQLLIAGGGGGTRTSVSQDGCDGRTSELGGAGSGGSTTSSCGTAGTLGMGGAVSSTSWGSGGGGVNGNGVADYTAGGGYAYVNGANGGYGSGGCGDTSEGGFGGGGSGQGCYGGGGGGGYTGGEGGRVAGGGGSYNSGSNTSNTAGFQAGDGEVTIDLL